MGQNIGHAHKQTQTHTQTNRQTDTHSGVYRVALQLKTCVIIPSCIFKSRSKRKLNLIWILARLTCFVDSVLYFILAYYICMLFSNLNVNPINFGGDYKE